MNSPELTLCFKAVCDKNDYYQQAPALSCVKAVQNHNAGLFQQLKRTQRHGRENRAGRGFVLKDAESISDAQFKTQRLKPRDNGRNSRFVVRSRFPGRRRRTARAFDRRRRACEVFQRIRLNRLAVRPLDLRFLAELPLGVFRLAFAAGFQEVDGVSKSSGARPPQAFPGCRCSSRCFCGV